MRQLWLLGPARVEQGRNAPAEAPENDTPPLPRFRSRRTVGLLGYLVTERRSLARSHLASLFWPDEQNSKGLANLSRELHNLAQILPDCWIVDRQSATFHRPANTEVDIYRLRQLEEQERWEEAADLLGGEFLEGLHLEDNPEFESWLLAERTRWQGRAELIFGRVIDGHTRRGRYTEALRQAQRLQRIAPWDEATHRQIMRLLAWTGQRGAALRQFESCKRLLLDELDVEPTLETIDLCRQIKAGKLDLPPQLPAFLTQEKPRHAFERRIFVGRESELVQLGAFAEQTLAGESQVAFVIGGPGRGKTALLDAFSERAMAMHSSLLVASGKCNAYSGIGDPFLPYRDMMSMLTGDVEGRWDAGAVNRDHAHRLWATSSSAVQILLDHGPHLLDVFVPAETLLSRATAAGQEYAPWLPRLRRIVRRRATGEDEVQQSQLFQQFAHVLHHLARNKPLLLILDDIQWADAASISLLFHLGRHLAGASSRLMIVGAYRPEEIALGREDKRHPLAKVLSEFKRTFGDVWVDLGRSEESEQRRFVDALLDAEPNTLGDGFRAALFDRTRGHPLFTVELLRAMQDRGDLLKDTDGAWNEGPSLDWQVIPARVEAVIEERIDQLDPQLRDILTIASVEGDSFTAQVVAEAGNAPERAVLNRLSYDLEQRHRLVSEQEEVEIGQRRLSRYRFGHILFQDYLYRRQSQGERRLLHGRVASALEQLYAGQQDRIATQLAHHFQLAGDRERAFHYFSLAAERAASIYASGEAISHYTRAIQLAVEVSAAPASLARLHRGRGLAFERLGEFERACRDLELALQIARTAGENRSEWLALLDLGKLWASRDHNQARSFFEAALEQARRVDDPAHLAASLNWMGNWHANNEDPQKAMAYHQEALDIFEELGNQRELANTLDLLGMANLLNGGLAKSVRYYDSAIALFRELDVRPMLITSLTGRAMDASMLVFLASIAPPSTHKARYDFDEALRIASEIDSAPDSAWVHWSLGLLYIVHGQFGHALDLMHKGLGIASDIGHREWIVCNRFALGILYNELFEPARAQEQLEEALILVEELYSPHYAHLVSGVLTKAYILLGNHELAHACLERVTLTETPMDTLGKRYCWVRRAELALSQGDPALALDITQRLIDSAPGMATGSVVTFLWQLKAESLAALGEADVACSLLRAAIEKAKASEERFLLWRLHASLARQYRTMRCLEASEEEQAIAQDLVGEIAATVPDETMRGRFLQTATGIATARSQASLPNETGPERHQEA
ncbi:MAG TPA: tetratricopeptide repeat protein [Anaerolineae bacterium]|nr:tetratricopeptide repeat protein [Anaerolineae bacterium]